VPKPAEQTSFSLALNEIASDGTASAIEMAHAARCSESHMRDVISICNSAQLSLRKAIRLSAWLVDERSETRQLQASGGKEGLLGETGDAHFVPRQIENDDDIRKEICAARNDATRAIEAFDNQEREEAARYIREGIRDYRAALEDIQQPAE